MTEAGLFQKNSFRQQDIMLRPSLCDSRLSRDWSIVQLRLGITQICFLPRISFPTISMTLFYIQPIFLGCWLRFVSKKMTSLLHAFSFVAQLVQICADIRVTSNLLCWSGFLPRRMTLSLNSFRFLSLLLGICAQMVKLPLNSFKLIPLLVGTCAEMDETSFEFVQVCLAAGRDLRQDG